MHGTRKRHPPVRHYLLTIQTSAHTHLHCYLMADDRRYALDAADKLVAEARRLGFNHPLLTTVLATPLEEDAGIVRGIVASHSLDAARLLQTATDYHLSIFWVHSAADDARLMALH